MCYKRCRKGTWNYFKIQRKLENYIIKRMIIYTIYEYDDLD